MILEQLDIYLRNLLNIDSISDISINGVQIGDLKQDIKKIALAVDTNIKTVQKACSEGADLLLVHHGIYWGKPFAIKGGDYNKISSLIKNDVALYAAHLPLDLHFPLGNNYQMVQKLGLSEVKPFGNYGGINLGFKGLFKAGLDQLKDACSSLSNTTRFIIGDENKYSRVAVVSGKAGFSVLEEAMKDKDVDLFITGELEHSLYNSILDQNMNVISLGHYESEKFGVQALGKHIFEELCIPSFFIDEPTGF